jgi:hypothetical protein
MIEQKTELQAAEVQLKYKSRIPKSKRVQIKTSKDAFTILLSYWNKDTIEHHEEFKALLLTTRTKCLG